MLIFNPTKSVTSIVEKSVSEPSEDYSEGSDGDTASQKAINIKITNHLDEIDIRNELQDILGKLMGKDISSIEMLQNNAKTIGSVLGAEENFFAKKGQDMLTENFYDKKTLEIQDLTFKEIEKTKLGRALTYTIEKLESKIVNLQYNITNMKENEKMKEAQIWTKAEEKTRLKFEEKQQ